MSEQGDSTLDQRYAILVEQKRQLQEKIDALEESQTYLNSKMDFYDKKIDNATVLKDVLNKQS